MVYDLRAYWPVYPPLLKTAREEKERQMLFKMSNPRACDEVCSSAECLSAQSNNVWQLHSGSAAGTFLDLALFCVAGLYFDVF